MSRGTKEVRAGQHSLVARELTADQVDTVYTTIEKGYKVGFLDILMGAQCLPEFVVNMSIEANLGDIVKEGKLAPSEFAEVYSAIKEVNPFLSESLVALSSATRTMFTMGGYEK